MTSPATAAIAATHRSRRPRFAPWIGCGLLLSALVAGCAPTMPEPGEWNSFAEKKAQARFKELCDTQAGEHIYKTVDNVEGYLWVSAWPDIGDLWSPEHTRQLRSQTLAAPADYCATCFVASDLAGGAAAGTGYSYYEIQYPSGTLTRTVAPDQHELVLDTKAIDTPQSRYMVTFETLGSPEDRQLWIGGSRLKVTDRQTGEVLAERTSFSRGYPRLLLPLYPENGPWGHQIRCPDDPNHSVSFTTKVLHPVGAKNVLK